MTVQAPLRVVHLDDDPDWSCEIFDDLNRRGLITPDTFIKFEYVSQAEKYVREG